jgi:glutamine synthetase type III
METLQEMKQAPGTNGNSKMRTKSVAETFGSNVFSEKMMKERLPKETYKALR